MKILFLDIDGVLNGHQEAAQSCCGIRADCAARLNTVIDATNCQLVISSAWRYMIHKGAMTLKGFEYLLQTHGVKARDRVFGLTCLDEQVYCRASQIRAWLRENPQDFWAVVDDDPMGLEKRLGADAWRLVKTDGERGLVDGDAERLIEVLGKV